MSREGDILRHELIGLSCSVAHASCKEHLNIRGKIVDETKNMMVIEQDGKEKMIPKKGTVFRVITGGKQVDVDGDTIAYRPEDRIKKVKRKHRKKS